MLNINENKTITKNSLSLSKQIKIIEKSNTGSEDYK
jgi:hypothetical protein